MPGGSISLYNPKSGKLVPVYGNKKSVDSKQNKEIKKLKVKVARLASGDEKKWFDIVKSSTAISTSGSVQPLLALNVWGGTDNTARQNEREGNTLVMLSYQIKGEVYIDKDFASPDANNKVRLMLVQMTDDNQAAPLLGDILETPSSNAALFSYYKIKGDRRFKVHFDKTYNLQNTNQTYSSSSAIMPTTTEPFRRSFDIKAKIPKKGLKVTYLQGSVSGNTPISNSMYIVAYSDSGVISHPAILYKSRMRFLDN